MGGAEAALEKAQGAFDLGDYRWVAELVNHVVFADPENTEARELQADALEQLGYQSESGPWRNFYLTAASELRKGVQKLPTPQTAGPDIVRSMELALFFDYLAMRLNGQPVAKSAQPVRAASWLAFVYVGTVSMWAGFFAWFRGLDWGGALRVSQVQLLQPFLSMLFAVPLLGERLDALSLGFALAVVATVFVGRRLSRPAAQEQPA